MVISTCGYGNTGASAVLDFLRGYRGLNVVSNFEFQLIHMPDGILDLKYHLTENRERIATNAALKRFRRAAVNGWFGRKMSGRYGGEYIDKTQRYIGKLLGVSWKGTSVYDPSDVSNLAQNEIMHAIQAAVFRLLRRINKNYHFPRYHTRYLSIMDAQTFDSITKEYLNDILSMAVPELGGDIVMDMLVSATNPASGMEFFDDGRVIVVHRDPVDLFLRANEHKSTNAFMPCSDVASFTKYYRMLMEGSVHSDDALYVRYEDLIYDYYPTTQRIMEYVGKTDRPEDEFKFFNPDLSVRYTRADLTYPGHDGEIKYIKEQLPEFLYKFPIKYTPVAKQPKQSAKG